MNEIFPELTESEDERIRKYLYSFVELNSGVNLPPEDAKKILAWLERQREQKIAEWSEEDEKNLRQVEYACMKFFGGDCSLIGWLRKSLKGRVGCEVNCTTMWKPSEGQKAQLKRKNK